MTLAEETRSWPKGLWTREGDELRDGRFPALREVYTALEEMDGYKPEFEQGELELLITIREITEGESGPWASLSLVGAVEGEASDGPRRIYFDAGWDSVMIALLERISKSTGPLVLVPHSGEPPTLVFHSS